MRKLILLIISLVFLGVPLSSNGLSFYYSMNFKSEIYYTPFFTQNLEIDPSEVNQDIMATGIMNLANPGEYTVVSVTANDTTWYAVFAVK